MDSSNLKNAGLDRVGIIYISPIIGITNSLIDTFKPITEKGVPVIPIDIFGDDYEKKTFWKILKLTMLPGAHSRRIYFTNSFPEHKVFDKIRDAIKQLLNEGRDKIVIGGMSGGFIFASRVVQSPPDKEIKNHNVLEYKHNIVGLFGISPLVFYPEGVYRPSAKLELIPSDIKTLLFFCDGDGVIPKETLGRMESLSSTYRHIEVRCLKCQEFGSNKPIRHQFFGGRDFIGPLKNPFWRAEVEKSVLDIKYNFLKEISSS